MAVRIFWTRQSREDLRGIRAFIARDAPATAAAFVRRLRGSVDRLREFQAAGLTEIALKLYGEPEQAIRMIGEHLVGVV